MSSSSLSSCPEAEGANDITRSLMGKQSLRVEVPFASEPDACAVKYLKDTSFEQWLRKYDPTMTSPSSYLLSLLGVTIPASMDEGMAVKLLRRTMHRIRQRRERLTQHSTVDDALRLLASARKIMVVTGAGISVSCGIPDFRSPTGLYARLEEFELDDPQQMFDIDHFKMNPEVFYSFAHQIYPSNFVPSPCHRFVKLLEDRGVLLRNYTQNIDNIEGIVGIKRLFQCHGSFATASCIVCRNQVPGSAIKDHIFAKTIPFCEICTKRTAALKPNNKGKRKGKWDDDDEDDDTARHLMKPDITFFGEKLASNFENLLKEDMRSEEFDLLLVIGTSLKVAPVADIVYSIPHSVPQILINKTLVTHANPDIVLLGDADSIVQYLCRCLKWHIPPPLPNPDADNGLLRNDGLHKGSTVSLLDESGGIRKKPTRLGNSHIWLFQGAEPGPLLNIAGTNSVKTNVSTASTAASSLQSLGQLRPRSVSASSSLSSLSSLESLPPPKPPVARGRPRLDLGAHRGNARDQKRARRD